jgi:hypothetical protein
MPEDSKDLAKRGEYAYEGSEVLPSSIPEVVADQATLTTIFESARTNWLQAFDRSEVLSKLKQYLSMSPDDRKNASDLKKYLRSLRKYGQTLKSACYFCNTEYKLPPSLDHFLRYLGKAVDAYSMKKGDKYAARVVAIMEQGELDIDEFQTVRHEDYKQRLATLVNKIKTRLLPKKITVEDYHTLRKDLRSIKNLCVLVSGREGCDRRIQQISDYLDTLNSELGKIHDEYVKKELREKVDYHQTYMKISSKLKARIKRFLELFQMQNVLET